MNPFDNFLCDRCGAKCQQARIMQELPLLRDEDGRLPSKEALEDSCKKYGLDYEDWFDGRL